MNDNDINYTIGGYSILEVVSTGLIAVVAGTVRFIVGLVRGSYEIIVDVKDKVADIKPQLIPQRRSVRPSRPLSESALVDLIKFRAGIS